MLLLGSWGREFHSDGSPTVEEKQLLTLPPVPSRVSSKQAINMEGSLSNVAQGATSYISSVPQVNCPDKEIFRGDSSFMTDETNVSSLDDESKGSGPDEEEVPDEAIPLGDEFIEGSYSGAIKLGLENPVPLKTSSSHKSHSHVEIPPPDPKKSSGPYPDYQLGNTKNPDKAKCTSKVTKGSASAVPQQSMTMPVILGNAKGVVGNALEGGQGVPVYSVVGHPNLTQYVMAPQAVPQQYQQVGDAQGIHQLQPSQSWDGAPGNHPRRLSQDRGDAHGNHPR